MDHLQSPFAIPREHVDALHASEGFCTLRSYLATNAAFCNDHSPCDARAQETWLLHRDMLHALIMPVVTLFVRASALAEAALCTRRTEDLELAFAGEARGAFLCLQCILTEEEEWCRGAGCPACVVNATLSTESHIRLTIAASLLSTASIASPSSTPSNQDAPAESRTLPPLPYILPALRSALASDPFWSDDADMWPYLLSRATQLSAGIQSLIAECIDLESLVSSPTSDRPAQKRGMTYPHTPSTSALPVEEKGVRLRKSKLAKRQLRMRDEEVDLMRRVAMQCWAKARMPKHVLGEVLGTGKVSRVRSLTCP
ncbi:hypothetical protein ACEQ8H_000480 [Pleosporales sp. CAS-2024a]